MLWGLKKVLCVPVQQTLCVGGPVLRDSFARAGLVLVTGVSACAHARSAAEALPSALDEVCDPRNSAALTAPLDTLRAGPAEFAVAKGWATNASAGPSVSLRRVNATLLVQSLQAYAAPPLTKTTRATLAAAHCRAATRR
jgi:hypothetical protein